MSARAAAGYNSPMPPESPQRLTLGRTGLEVYRLGFGGIPIQRVSEAEAVATVRHAIERGVDFIDTSRAYTTSERRIGLALKEVGIGATAGSPARGRVAWRQTRRRWPPGDHRLQVPREDGRRAAGRPGDQPAPNSSGTTSTSTSATSWPRRPTTTRSIGSGGALEASAASPGRGADRPHRHHQP